MSEPIVIQGGMGIGVSGWKLARAVSETGNMGTVSGTVLDQAYARRLQDGDADGNARRAAENFPEPALARRVVQRYFIDGGRPSGRPYAKMPKYKIDTERELLELAIVANFAEIWLAKEGHNGPVGINYMEKLRVANLPAIYGAMLAGVDYVAIGAGIPRDIPGILDKLAIGESVSQRLDVEGAGTGDDFCIRFDPSEFIDGPAGKLARPKFLAIVASTTLAVSMARKSTGRVDGFVIEGPTAGGHNAPPRGEVVLSDEGEPVYGERDKIDFAKIRSLEIPFWLAGGYSDPGKLARARETGAAGVQVGTTFALSEESNLLEPLRLKLLEETAKGGKVVFSSPTASPTGFPFKLAQIPGTLSDEDVYDRRPRICDMGYLRTAYKKNGGGVGWRCPAEPVETFIRKGGTAEAAAGRICLCNGLIANIGLPQVRKDGYVEPPVVTVGDDISSAAAISRKKQGRFSATDVIDYLLR